MNRSTDQTGRTDPTHPQANLTAHESTNAYAHARSLYQIDRSMDGESRTCFQSDIFNNSVYFCFFLLPFLPVQLNISISVRYGKLTLNYISHTRCDDKQRQTPVFRFKTCRRVGLIQKQRANTFRGFKHCLSIDIH